MKYFRLNGNGIHIIAVLLFMLISYIYFLPVIEGKKLITNDNSVYKASSKEIIEYRERYKEEPLWTNSMFGGMPAYQISVRYKDNLTRPILGFLQSFKFPVAAIFLALLGFYFLLVVYGLNPWLAIAGAVAFTFSSYNFIIIAAGHNTKAYAIAYMAPMIAGIILATRKNRIAGAALTALFLSFELISNHLQITYYALMLIIIYGFSELIFAYKEKTLTELWKSLGILVIAALLAVGSNFTHLNITREYTKFTTRGGSSLSSTDNKSGLDKEYATSWSIGVKETLTLLIPNFMGGGSSFTFEKGTETSQLLQRYKAQQLSTVFRKYWGEQPGTSSVYAGAIVVFLFVLGLFLVDGREKWWLLAGTALSIFLSWGKNFMPLTNLFLDYLPGYNKFRAVSTVLVISGFTIPLLGALALRTAFQFEVESKRFYKSLIWAGGITAGLCLIFAVQPGIAGNFISSADLSIFNQLKLTPDIQSAFQTALATDRREMLQNDAFRSFIFICLAASLLLVYYKKKIQMKYAAGILVLLLLADMWPVSKRYLNDNNFEIVKDNTNPYPLTAADKAILQDKSIDYRVLNLTVSPFNDASTSNYHKSIGGYHGAKLQIYNELIEYSLTPEINDFISTFQENQDPGKLTTELTRFLDRANSLNMLNTKYIIIDPNGPPYINNSALGNAWFVDTVKIAENADEEIGLINSFKPAREAIINKNFRSLLTNNMYQTDTARSIELISYKPNELKYASNSAYDGLAVFSEIFYPAGWKAFIDGKEVPYLKADYVLRALEVPGGKHEIVFIFNPDSYNTGSKVSLASSLLLILLCAGSIIIEFRKRKKSE